MTFGDGTFGAGTFGAPAWQPGDEWPSGMAGGASSPHWGGYIRVWIFAGLEPGVPFHIGTHPNASLDSGNVMAGAEVLPRTVPAGKLWVDLSCDVMSCDIQGGASSAQGLFTKADAATLTATLSDPDGIYDPLNGSSPYAYQGRSRLTPGTPVVSFAEVVDPADATVTRHWLFTGTADSWAEPWTAERADRHARLVATDVTKQWVRYDRPEQPEQGAGDTTGQRVERLVEFYDWPGTIIPGTTSHVTLQATTLAQSGWELLNRTLDDELGFVYFTTEGDLRWVDRAAWSTLSAPVLDVGCPHVDSDPNRHDIIIDANPSAFDAELRNAVYASRVGGTMQSAISTSSQAQFGVYDYKRTDLAVETDLLVGQWATDVLSLYAYPQVGLKDVTLLPALDGDVTLWDQVLDITLITDLVRFVWAPHELPENVVDMIGRIVGFRYRITYDEWEVEWQLVGLDSRRFSQQVFKIGSVPGASDQLDAGYVLGFV